MVFTGSIIMIGKLGKVDETKNGDIFLSTENNKNKQAF
jgi:hypothetical protein